MSDDMNVVYVGIYWFQLIKIILSILGTAI